MSRKISLLPDPTVTTSIVMIDETVSGTTTSVQYLNLGVDSSGKVRLLRTTVIGSWDISTSYTTIEQWLENTFVNYFDVATRNALSSTSIITLIDSQIVEVAKNVFSLSSSEVGGSGAYGTSILPVLKVWKNTTNNYTARIAKNNTGGGKQYRLRASTEIIVSQNGNLFAEGPYAGVRPCLSFDPDTLVSDPDENGICYLLPNPDKPYREAEAEMLIGTPTVAPKQGIVQLAYENCMTGYPEVYVTADYDPNSANTWQQIQLGVPFDFSDTGTSLGLKVYARSESQAKIYEPFLNTLDE